MLKLFINFIYAGLLTIIVFIVGAILFAIPVYFLWNWLMPLFGLVELTLIQAWGLTVLSSLLIKTSSTKVDM